MDDSSQRPDDGPDMVQPLPSRPSELPSIVLQQPHVPRRPWWPWLACLGWAGFLVCGFFLYLQQSAHHEYYDVTDGVLERFHSGKVGALDKVAVIVVRGVILEGDGFVKQQIDRIRRDDRVRAIVLRVESPGGTVTGSDHIYHHLQELRDERHIPLVVSMGSIATSGGYYISMAVGEQERSIYAEPTTTTGSIGVIVPHFDLTGLLARYDVKDDSITSHPRKQILRMTRSMSDEDRELIQAYVDESFDRFKEIVKRGRPKLRQGEDETRLLDPETERNLATGEIFTAGQAKRFGLIDEIGFIEQAIERAAELANLDVNDVRVVKYERPPTLLTMAGIPTIQDQDTTLALLFELNAPRAYYLATSLPLLARTSDD